MHIFATLSLLPIFARVIHAQDNVNAIISEITPYITQISAIIQAEATPILSDLSELIQALAPTGVVGDLPAVLSTNIPAIDSILLNLITSAIPPGSIPTELAAAIPALVSDAVVIVISDVDDILTQLPGTVSNAALPTLLASYIPVIGSEVQAAASSLLPELSSLLATAVPSSTPASARNGTVTAKATATATATVGATAPGTVVTKPSTTTSSASATTSAARFSGAAGERMSWGMEVAAVVGFAAVVAAM